MSGPSQLQRRVRLALILAIVAAVVTAVSAGYRMTPKQRILRGMNRIDVPSSLQLESDEAVQCFICIGETPNVRREYSANVPIGHARRDMDAALVDAGFHRVRPAGEIEMLADGPAATDSWRWGDLAVQVHYELGGGNVRQVRVTGYR